MLALPEVVDGDYLFDAFPITGDGKGDGPVFLIGHKGTGGNDHDLVSHGCFGVVHFAAADYDTVAFPFHYVKVQIGVFLLGRPLHPVAFNVGLGAAADEVLILEILQPFQEILVILGRSFVLLVGFKRDGVAGVGAVYAHAALNAAADLAAEGAGHILLLVQVFFILVNVGEAVDGLAGDMALGEHKSWNFGSWAKS